MRQHEGIESFHFIGYIDTLSVIVLVFVVIIAFTAIAFSFGKEALLKAQKETEELRVELQRYQKRLNDTGFQNFQEIPSHLRVRAFDLKYLRSIHAIEYLGYLEQRKPGYEIP